MQAADAAGNLSPVVTRQLSIDTSCGAGEFRCPSSGQCSIAGLCVDYLPERLRPAVEAASKPYVPPVDTEAPDLQLKLLPGDVPGEQVQPGSTRMMHVVTTQLVAGERFREPGVTAIDAADGDLSTVVSKLGLRGLADTTGPTQGTPHLIEYRVADAAGNLALALRAVHIECAAGEKVCNGTKLATCSQDGICAAYSLSLTDSQPGEVTMMLLGSSIVYVPFGSTYAKCPAQQPIDIICDRV